MPLVTTHTRDMVAWDLVDEHQTIPLIRYTISTDLQFQVLLLTEYISCTHWVCDNTFTFVINQVMWTTELHTIHECFHTYSLSFCSVWLHRTQDEPFCCLFFHTCLSWAKCQALSRSPGTCSFSLPSEQVRCFSTENDVLCVCSWELMLLRCKFPFFLIASYLM